MRNICVSIMAVASFLSACAPIESGPGTMTASAPRYVAMGSSFAAGPGVTQPADRPANRCTRSADNFAHQLARKRGLALVDVSCGGATTAHILGPWNELPAQLDALDADTRLVTVTIGGNDLGYIGGLMTQSCENAKRDARPTLPLCEPMLAYVRSTAGALPTASEDNWRATEQRMDEIAREVRRRSPRARLVFVDYLTVLPEGRLCALTPLSPGVAAHARAIAARLADLTATVARRNGAAVVRASALSKGHDACSADPWITGFTPSSGTAGAGFAPYHPTLAGMTAVAEALDRELRREGWKGQATGLSR